MDIPFDWIDPRGHRTLRSRLPILATRSQVQNIQPRISDYLRLFRADLDARIVRNYIWRLLYLT